MQANPDSKSPGSVRIRHTVDSWEARVVRGFIAALAIYGCVYIVSVRRNTITENQFTYVPLVQKYYEGSLTLADLWFPFGEHRVLGYKLLFLANAIWLHLNSLVEGMLMPLVFWVGSLKLFQRYQRSIGSNASAFQQLAFIPIAFLFAAPSQYAEFANGMIVGLAIGSTLFMVCYILLERVLLTPTRDTRLAYAAVVPTTILLFGSGYSTGFAATVLIVSGVAAFLRGRQEKRATVRLLLWVSVPLLTAIAIYMIPWAGSPVGNALLGKNLPWVLMRPIASLKFICLMMASTLLSTAIYAQAKSMGVLVALGGLVLFSYGFVMWKFFRDNVWKTQWLPLLLMVHTLANVGTVLLGRSRLGEGYSFYPQYVLQTKLGTIGLLWILFDFSRASVVTANRTRAVVATVITISCQAYSLITEWSVAPFRRAVFEAGLNATLYDEESLFHLAPGKEANTLLAEPGETQVGLAIAKEYKLSAYSACPTPGRTLHQALLSDGWYPEENGSYWIAQSARFIIRTGPAGHLLVEGYVPPDAYERAYKNDLEVTIRSGTREIVKKKVEAGTFSLETEVCSECDARLSIELSKYFIPRDVGLGVDDRALGLLITNIRAD